MFTRLRPLFALFVRSLREQSRTKFTPLARGGIALLILILIAMNERSFTNSAAPGQQVLALLAIVNFFVIAIFGLSTFASAITEEKEDDTLGLLRMTRLNPLAILLGKSTARLFEGLLLLAVQVPFTMLCITLGGVSLEQVLGCYAILASFLFFLCNVSLLWSVVCRRTSRATSMTLLTGVALYFLPLFLMPVAFGARLRGNTAPTWYQSFAQWSLSINPVSDLTRTAFPRGGGLSFGANSISASLIGGVICFAVAWLLFAPCCNVDGEAAPARRARNPTTASTRRRGVPRPGLRAIAWKDFHFLSGGYTGLITRSIIYLGIAGLLALWGSAVGRSSFKVEQFAWFLLSFGWVAFSVEIGLVSARLFGSERKRNTLGSLFTLPIGTGHLIWQKILGALPSFIPSVTLAFTGYAILVGGQNGGRIFAWGEAGLATLGLFVSQYVFFAVLVMYLSLRMRRAVLATAICLMFAANMPLVAWAPRSYGSGGSEAYLVSMSAIIWIGIVALAAQIPRRLAFAAAGD